MSPFYLPRDSIQSNNGLESLRGPDTYQTHCTHTTHTPSAAHNFNLEREKLFPVRALMKKYVGKKHSSPVHHLLHNRAEPWHVSPLHKCFFSSHNLNWGPHRSRPGWNTATQHKGAGLHSHCRSCMGSQGDLRTTVIVYIHCMRAANQSAMRVASSVHVSVPEMLNIALDDRGKERKTVIYEKRRTTSGPILYCNTLRYLYKTW